MLSDNLTRAITFTTGPFMELCTPAEMAEYLNIDDSTIRQAIRQGRLIIGRDCCQFGKQWLLSRHAWKSLCGDYQKFSTLKVDCCKTIRSAENETVS